MIRRSLNVVIIQLDGDGVFASSGKRVVDKIASVSKIMSVNKLGGRRHFVYC